MERQVRAISAKGSKEVMRYVDGAQRGRGSRVAATALGKKKIRTKVLKGKKAW